ncbi:hypothetical protein NKR19_g5613 [Coniochaeta hoffmannii]|uniref:Uncharacterized protein n=1 Tax=Coniochaeta hoffmannii TaxID=91930 RepID=A0AA38RJ55_9PEZI|nr:hypothetical protein NKR19_g5613 [Coniochaeta hoffmannii]
MPSFFRLRKPSPPEKEPVPVPKKPGPAQRQLSEGCGITSWSPGLFDFDSIEAEEADLNRRLATYDQVSQDKLPATSEGAGTGYFKLAKVTTDKGVAPQQQQQRKKPLLESTGARQALRLDVIKQRQTEARRRTKLSTGLPSPPLAPPQTSSTGARPGRDVYDWADNEDPSHAGTICIGSLCCAAALGTLYYLALLARAELAQREAARWIEDNGVDPLLKRCDDFTQRLDRDEAGTAKQTPRQANQGGAHDVVFGGEHPNVAFGRSLAQQDYQRRKAYEQGLVDPDTVPVDTTWQAGTYSGRAVGSAWVKLERELGNQEPINTSAVPGPLNISAHRPTKVKPNVDWRHMPRSRSPTGYAVPRLRMSYCHAAKRPMPGRHVPSLDRGCSCQHDNLDSQGDQAKPGGINRSPAVVMKKNGCARDPRALFALQPHPRHNATGSTDADDTKNNDDDRHISSRPASTRAKAYRAAGNYDRPRDDTRRGSDSSDSDILAPARARRFS